MLLEANQLHRLDRLAESEISSRVCGESSHSDDDGESSSAPSLDSSSNISAELPEEDRRRIMFGLTRGGLSSRIYWALKLDLLSDEEDDEEELESDWESGSEQKEIRVDYPPVEFDAEGADEWTHPDVFTEAEDDGLALHRCPTRLRPWPMIHGSSALIPLPHRRRSSACTDAIAKRPSPDLTPTKSPETFRRADSFTADDNWRSDSPFLRVKQWLAMSSCEDPAGGASEMAEGC